MPGCTGPRSPPAWRPWCTTPQPWRGPWPRPRPSCRRRPGGTLRWRFRRLRLGCSQGGIWHTIGPLSASLSPLLHPSHKAAPDSIVPCNALCWRPWCTTPPPWRGPWLRLYRSGTSCPPCTVPRSLPVLLSGCSLSGLWHTRGPPSASPSPRPCPRRSISPPRTVHRCSLGWPTGCTNTRLWSSLGPVPYPSRPCPFHNNRQDSIGLRGCPAGPAERGGPAVLSTYKDLQHSHSFSPSLCLRPVGTGPLPVCLGRSSHGTRHLYTGAPCRRGRGFSARHRQSWHCPCARSSRSQIGSLSTAVCRRRCGCRSAPGQASAPGKQTPAPPRGKSLCPN